MQATRTMSSWPIWYSVSFPIAARSPLRPTKRPHWAGPSFGGSTSTKAPKLRTARTVPSIHKCAGTAMKPDKSTMGGRAGSHVTLNGSIPSLTSSVAPRTACRKDDGVRVPPHRRPRSPSTSERPMMGRGIGPQTGPTSVDGVASQSNRATSCAFRPLTASPRSRRRAFNCTTVRPSSASGASWSPPTGARNACSPSAASNRASKSAFFPDTGRPLARNLALSSAIV
mmetsp:Transcript_108547/g.305975  ORF Transcript_108547/g.305975 Transcript_108547/m.305975 type:complete len:227 (+) Transcript_108547:156-836(+)